MSSIRNFLEDCKTHIMKNEASPPDPEIEKWTSDPKVKKSFQDQYGDKWQERLYQTAWSKYNSKKEENIKK